MATTTTTSSFKVLGMTQDVDICECCGKTGLKRTVILGALDADGNVMADVYYGTRCAALALQYRGTGRSLEVKAEHAQRAAEEARRREVHVVCENPLEEDGRTVIWVVESVGGNGGSIDFLCFARGTRSRIRDWAAARYPHKSVEVRRSF